MTGIVVPADAFQPLRKVELDNRDIDTMRSILGGPLGVVDITHPSASLWHDDDGKLELKPVNQRATLMWWVHCPHMRERDFLVGDILITGAPDGRGDMKSTPTELLTLLFETEQFKVEAQVRNSKRWSSNSRRYSNWMAAYHGALHMIARWQHVKVVRVVPA